MFNKMKKLLIVFGIVLGISGLLWAWTGTPPTCTTDPATLVRIVSATMNGTCTDDGGADPGCEVEFEWGLTDSYGTETGWSDHDANPIVTNDTFSANLTGLKSETTYHYRAKIRNASYSANGADATFKTRRGWYDSSQW